MIKLSHYFISIIFLLCVALGAQILYMHNTSSLHVEEKNTLVRLVGLPDLALSNSANFIRHRSYSDTFSFFSNDPELLEFFPSTFVYNYSPSHKDIPSRIEIED